MTPHTQSTGELDRHVDDKLTEIFSDAADKVAPKQPSGSIERTVALGMMAETLMPLKALIRTEAYRLAREVIGEDIRTSISNQHQKGYDVSKTIRNQLRAEQRQRLQSLIQEDAV